MENQAFEIHIRYSIVLFLNAKRRIQNAKWKTKRKEEFVSNNFISDWMVKAECRSTIYHQKIQSGKHIQLVIDAWYICTGSTNIAHWHMVLFVCIWICCVPPQSLFRLVHFLCSFFCLFVSCFWVRRTKNDYGNSIRI